LDLVEESFSRLFPGKDFVFSSKIKYSGKFKDFNANVRLRGSFLEFGFSRKWRGVSREIQVGLVQSLLLKILNSKKDSTNIDLYNSFVKCLHLSVPKTLSDPLLESSFNRVNDKYFFGLVEIPNLCWGSDSLRRLGSYDFQTDTVVVSTIFRGADMDLLDYVVYHELLHKKHKFSFRNGRNYHHTSTFRDAESKFENCADVERRIKLLASGRRIRGYSSFFGSLKRNFSFFDRKL
jgi:hypothetical protein